MDLQDFFWDETTIRKNKIEKIINDNWIVIAPGSFTINLNGSIDVIGSVKFAENMSFLKEIPLQFNHVTGDFDCSRLSLLSLKGSPVQVDGVFDCSYNQLSSLEFLPRKAGCFVIDNNVSLFTNGSNCDFDKVVLLHITDKSDHLFSKEIDSKSLKVFFKLQNYYDVWNSDKTLNKAAFAGFLKDIKEGLE